MPVLFAIDPGKSGAIARFSFDSSSLKLIELIDTPMIGKEYNYYEIADILRTQKPDITIIEQTQVRSGEGVLTALEVGTGKGMWLMAFAALELKHQTVQASAWTKRLKLPSSKGLSDKDNKANHVNLACKLFPEFAKQFYGTRGGLRDGRADAALIGEDWFRQFCRDAPKLEDEIPSLKIKLESAVF